MARIVEVSDAMDSRLRDYVDLRDVQMRKLLESERGIFLAEGQKVIRRAIESGNTPRSFLMSRRWVDSLADLLERSEADCFVLGDDEIERLTGFHVHRGALACLDRPSLSTPTEVIADACRIVVVEDLADHTNVGAIFRSAAALGFDAILLSPRCADPLYRRSIKVSMGAVFWLPYARIDNWYNAPAMLRDSGFTTLAMSLADDSIDLFNVPKLAKLALIVGSEGHGLSSRWSTESALRVKIPMSPQIDSLNVASAVAVACWHLRR